MRRESCKAIREEHTFPNVIFVTSYIHILLLKEDVPLLICIKATGSRLEAPTSVGSEVALYNAGTERPDKVPEHCGSTTERCQNVKEQSIYI